MTIVVDNYSHYYKYIVIIVIVPTGCSYSHTNKFIHFLICQYSNPDKYEISIIVIYIVFIWYTTFL